MYKIESKPGVLLITVSGFIKQDEANEFVKDYKLKTQFIKPSLTSLILDGQDLATSAQDMLPLLQGCLSMYINDNFKKIFLTKFKSIIAMGQLKNLDKSFLGKVTLVDSIEDALKQI